MGSSGEQHKWRGSQPGGSSGTTAAMPGQTYCGDDEATESGRVAHGLAGVLAGPATAGAMRRPAS